MKKLLSVAAVAAVAVLAAHPAFAAQATAGGAKDSIDQVAAQVVSVPTFINYGSYIIGAALGVSGISKLKAHVDNPGQTAIKDGLGRVGASAMFISLPFVLDMVKNTTGADVGGQGAYQGLADLAP